MFRSQKNAEWPLVVPLLALCALLGAGEARVQQIPGLVLGPPMNVILVKGQYVEAIRIAYDDWRAPNRKASIENQFISIRPVSGSRFLHVWFVPKPDRKVMLGCSTSSGIEIHYVIDEQRRKIVRKEIPC